MELFNKTGATPLFFKATQGDLSHTLVLGCTAKGKSFNPVEDFASAPEPELVEFADAVAKAMLPQ